MEILSTGEKIKRARIYKGRTLKDICEDKISVSKMSCIENGKINAEDWILKFIAKKLELDVGYLGQDVKEQLENNIKEMKKCEVSPDYENNLEYNLRYAEEYEFVDIVFEIIHLMFNYYLDKGETEKLQIMISKYYDYCQKCNRETNRIIYYMDIGKFFSSIKEYNQAANYYSNVRKSITDKEQYSLLAEAIFEEAKCYLMMNSYDKSYELAVKLIDLLQYIQNDIRKAEVYHMLAFLSVRMDKGKFKEYEEKSYELYNNNMKYKAFAIFHYAEIMFETGMAEKATEYVVRSIKCYPTDNEDKLVKFMINCIRVVLKNSVLDKAQEICDETLNLAIKIDNIKYIEECYYFKSKVLQKNGALLLAETYMNLSLDALLKFGTKQDIYERYMEMGAMYHMMDNTAESIKYFNLAIKMEKMM